MLAEAGENLMETTNTTKTTNARKKNTKTDVNGFMWQNDVRIFRPTDQERVRCGMEKGFFYAKRNRLFEMYRML